jgi:SAM-dependent methyltransferase
LPVSAKTILYELSFNSGVIMSLMEYYFGKIAAAYVRGKKIELPERLSGKYLDDLAGPEIEEIIRAGLDAGLRLHRFKQTMGLARVQRVLGALRGLAPSALLDVGSGRGTFLWPLLDAFSYLPITSIDRDERRVADILAVRDGGFNYLDARSMDVTSLKFDDGSFDLVTMLEVLEHIPEAQKALDEVVRVAGRFVLVSVPSKEDDNPEHIHLFDQKKLGGMLESAGARRVSFDYVLNHIIAIARVGD